MKNAALIIGMGAPDKGAGGPPNKDMDDGTVCIPLKALAQPDDQDQMQTPAKGDPVSFQVDGQVMSIDGDNAYVKPTAVNGTPLPDSGEEDAGDEDETSDSQTPDDSGLDQEGQGLRDEAQQMSNSGPGY